MKTHFLNLLHYMAYQNDFQEMMNIEEPEWLLEKAGYIEENGLTVYGYAAIMNKESMLDLNQQEEVYQIYTQPLK